MPDATRWERVKVLFEAALDRRAEERAAFLAEACADDPDLRRELESLLQAHAVAGDFLAAPEAADEPEPALVGQRIGPYRVLGEIGHGGMGVVYRATREDDVLHKTVALKIVHSGAGPDSLRRFGRERQILAQLQHPNIATILDGGETDEGQPYLVMEHVEGEPIDAYCERYALGVAARLQMFRMVCGAVHYAHQNLVVHRDIKPANILVTADGHPKLLDFGIAKLLTPSDTERTATLMPLMTPAYASPEQLRGLPVTTASDVYSLGVVAYELLTGQTPFHKDERFEDRLRTVSETEPPAPSVALRAGRTTRSRIVASDLRGDLDTILLKALRREPARRYLSAQELADDIGRHLAGRPVLARKDTVRYRLGKFVGRHRAGVGVAALVVLLVAAGVFEIVRQARIAEANRVRAERRFADVRRMANSFLFELHDAIKDLPGSTRARALVLRRGLEYLDSLAQEAGGDPVLQQELATAYEKVAEVQGSPFAANLGDSAGATETLRKAVAIREALMARAPRALEPKVDFVLASSRLSLLEDELGQSQAGLARIERALALLDGAPRGRAVDRAAARAHETVGNLLFKTSDRARALAEQRRSLAIWRAEAAAHPDDVEALRSLHLILGDVARSLSMAGATEEALEHYRGAVAAAEARLRLAPQDPVAQRDLNNGTSNLAAALVRAGRRDEATTHMARVLAFDEDRLRADANDTQAQRDVFWDLSYMSQIAYDDGRFEDALAYDRRSEALAAARLQASPTSFQARKDVAEGWTGRATILLALGRLDEAADASASAIEHFERLHADNPTQSRVTQLLGDAYAQRGELHETLAARGGERAAAHWREARAATLRALERFHELDQRGALDADRRAQLVTLAAALARRDAALARR